MLPANYPLALGTSDPARTEALALAASGTLRDNLIRLGRFWKLKIRFTVPVGIGIRRWIRWSGKHVPEKSSDVHVFSGFFLSSGDRLCYLLRRGGRRGMYFPSLDLVKEYEIVLSDTDEFRDYEEFRKRFDPRFITEDYIKELWNTKSPQHGGPFRKSDFRTIGPKGRMLMERFLKKFPGVLSGDRTAYSDTGYLAEHYTSRGQGRFGRNISISHRITAPFVHYSSEFPGCGNGSYGLAADARHWLWIEND